MFPDLFRLMKPDRPIDNAQVDLQQHKTEQKKVVWGTQNKEHMYSAVIKYTIIKMMTIIICYWKNDINNIEISSINIYNIVVDMI